MFTDSLDNWQISLMTTAITLIKSLIRGLCCPTDDKSWDSWIRNLCSSQCPPCQSVSIHVMHFINLPELCIECKSLDSHTTMLTPLGPQMKWTYEEPDSDLFRRLKSLYTNVLPWQNVNVNPFDISNTL